MSPSSHNPRDALDSLIKVDRLCCEFESLRLPRTPADVRRLVDQVPSAELRLALLTELMRIEFEARSKQGLVTSGVADSLRFRHELAGHVSVDLVDRDLAIAEFSARQRWGDQPSVDDFCAWTQNSDPAFALSLHQQLEILFPLRVTFFEDDRKIAACDFSRPIEFGRRQQRDPAKGEILDADDRVRVVIAAETERHLSRRQGRFERTSADRYRVTNTGSALSFDADLSERVAPGKSVEKQGNCLIRLENYMIQLERPAS